MTEEEIIKSKEFKTFYSTILTMSSRSYDRDNTILLSLKYENFKEFYEEYKSLFVVHFDNEASLIKAILRIFFCSQLSCINQDSEKTLDFVSNFIEEHYEHMLEILLKHHKKTYEEILFFNRVKAFKLL